MLKPGSKRSFHKTLPGRGGTHRSTIPLFDPSESRSAGLQIFRKVIPWEPLLKICRLKYRSEIKLPGLLRNSEFRSSASDCRKVVPLDLKICGRKVQKMGNLRAEWFVNLSEPGLPI